MKIRELKELVELLGNDDSEVVVETTETARSTFGKAQRLHTATSRDISNVFYDETNERLVIVTA